MGGAAPALHTPDPYGGASAQSPSYPTKLMPESEARTSLTNTIVNMRDSSTRRLYGHSGKQWVGRWMGDCRFDLATIAGSWPGGTLCRGGRLEFISTKSRPGLYACEAAGTAALRLERTLSVAAGAVVVVVGVPGHH
uniref:Uncharacterized protein n=1 Tax=Plectus sambesii TaxID=2011161 RepID=A0A914VVK8_9BILA